jgi:hypothetical protein
LQIAVPDAVFNHLIGLIEALRVDIVNYFLDFGMTCNQSLHGTPMTGLTVTFA